jgi:hypothetical protein
MSDSVSDRLVAQLEAQAKLVDHGEFTMDDAAARTKLAQFRLAEPSDWVCLVVEAATAFGATRVQVIGQLTQLWIRFDGEPLDGDEIFSTSSGNEGLRKLAIAISTLFGHYAVSAVEIESPRGRVRLHAEGRNERSASEERENLIRVLGLPEGERERERLRERCRYSPIAVDLEYERISFGLHGALVDRRARNITAIVDGEHTIGWVGWAPGSSPAEILLLTHGVITEIVHATTWEGLAIVDVPLRKDVGERAVLRDAEFERILALVEAAAPQIPREATPEPEPQPEPAPPTPKPFQLPEEPVHPGFGLWITLCCIALVVVFQIVQCAG